MCAMTVYAARCSQLKDRLVANQKSANPNFTTQFNNAWALANLGRLSRMNVIWLGKRIHEMIERWVEPDQREMLDRLSDRQARAWKRWEARIAEKQAAKAAGTTKGRSKTETPAPAAPAANVDPWEE